MKHLKNLFSPYVNAADIFPASDIPQLQDINEVQPAEAEAKTCSTCAEKSSAPLQYVYALGKIRPRFPNLSIEKEFTQVVGREQGTKGKTDNEVMAALLSEPQNRYLARKLCWTFSIEGLETYLLQPMNAVDLDMLTDSLKSNPKTDDIDLVIGILGPLAPASYCNGLQLPIVGYDQVYSFDKDSLLASLPDLGNPKDDNFKAMADELFERIRQMTDNAGATDDYRALNYLAVRHPGIYATVADNYSRNFSLTGVDVRQSPLNSTRKMVDVIFTFSSRANDVTEKYYCRVDVTEEFPFLVTKMQVYISR